MITVVDYGSGNLASVVNMGRKAGGDLQISSDPRVVAEAEKIILPGVGAFARAMSNLRERGLIPALQHAVMERQVPILGLCVGIQLLSRRSEEGAAEGLGWIAADTYRFDCDRTHGLRVPHMGWNHVQVAKADPLVATLPERPRFYFVHSYYVRCDDDRDVLLWSEHGPRFAAAIQHGHIRGAQFHPEKSHQFGLALFRQFVALR